MKVNELLEARQPSLEQRVRSAIREVEHELPHEARFKEFDFNLHDKIVWYVTQESTKYEDVAEQIAHFFTDEKLPDWTIYVINRYEWDGRYPREKENPLKHMSDDPEIQKKLADRTKKKARKSDKEWGMAKSWRHEYMDDEELN